MRSTLAMCEPHAAPTALETGTRPHDWSAHGTRARANHNHTEPCVERRHAERTCKPRLMIGKHGLATVALHEQVFPSASPIPCSYNLLQSAKPLGAYSRPLATSSPTPHVPTACRYSTVLSPAAPRIRVAKKPSNANDRKACNFRPNVVCKPHRCRGLRVLHESGVVACRFHIPRPSNWHVM